MSSADEITNAELRAGVARLGLVQRCKPAWVVPLGVTAYRQALRRPGARIGRQSEDIGGRPVWLLPNPSGRVAAYSTADLVELYAQLRRGSDCASENNSSTARRQAGVRRLTIPAPLRPFSR